MQDQVSIDFPGSTKEFEAKGKTVLDSRVYFGSYPSLSPLR